MNVNSKLMDIGLLISSIVYIFIKKTYFISNIIKTIIIYPVSLIAVICVVYFASQVCDSLGEPYGTLLFTCTVTIIEIGVILTSPNGITGTIIKDTTFASIMIAIGLFAGLSVILANSSNQRPKQNLDAASSYTSIISALGVICLILPNIIQNVTENGYFNLNQSILISFICIVLYISFVYKQTVTDKDSFIDLIDDVDNNDSKEELKPKEIFINIAKATGGMILLILLSKELNKTLEIFVNNKVISQNIPGLIVATLILAPEGITAIIAAKANKLQKAINLCLGSALATIALALPFFLIYSALLPVPIDIILGLNTYESCLLLLILATSSLIFSQKMTSISKGLTLLSIFLIYAFMLL